MDAPTLLEVEVERDAVASVLDAVPGVAVVDDATVPTPPPAESDEADGPGLTDRLGSLWRQWGLLGTGLSLIALGAATAGLWWYRRRGADGGGGESTEEYASDWAAQSRGETPPPAEQAPDTPSPTDTDLEPTAPAGDVDDTPTPETRQTALASETLPGRSEQRRRDTERSGVAESAAGVDAPERDETERGEAGGEETEADERPEAKIDPAPLLGAAFLVLSSALGRWATRDRSEQA